ncbi:ABC transporter ATP-binding protein [Rhodopseudomonas sp. P2A-2r]|uniref:ABC transporter ATP-binding protein n=1 Tax=unclassified Rhodopseudomonas TaxID=2638247 RepID=UPI002234E3E5|nr:oligopeptide/dipeptide ABC transporter ATP-binding protein [Rhodopseudomonas sp. P2A-2r]UZE46705.1 ATP-binding cassette domain-containing protein [Rhodopseudomonas sp. P2A-2r]
MTTPLLSVDGLVRSYRMKAGMFGHAREVRAVDGVSFAIPRGKTLGLVGESGSGKSTTGRLVLGLENPDAGAVGFDGAPLAALDSTAWRASRARMQMIFQNPLGALDRLLPIATQLREPLDIHRIGDAASRAARVADLMRRVGLSRDIGQRYPHELSGGQRQRAVLARALTTKPDFLVCDEPVSALDVSIQAQVVNLLTDLQAELNLTMLFISHDLRVVRQISERVAVMYLGRVVELGDADDLFASPQHPYTRALVSASPTPGRRKAERIVLTGEPPNPAAKPAGCGFHPRCPIAFARCRVEAPDLAEVAPGRSVACHQVGSGSSARAGALH